MSTAAHRYAQAMAVTERYAADLPSAWDVSAAAHANRLAEEAA